MFFFFAPAELIVSHNLSARIMCVCHLFQKKFHVENSCHFLSIWPAVLFFGMPSHSVLNFNPLLRKSYELQQFDWFQSYWYFEFSYAIIQLWYALAKTLSEQAAWALAMDRLLCMVSINAGLVLGPAVTQQNPQSTMFYLKGRNAHTSHSIVTLKLHKIHVYLLFNIHYMLIYCNFRQGQLKCTKTGSWHLSM